MIAATNRKAIEEFKFQDFTIWLINIIKLIFCSEPSIFGKIWFNILTDMIFPLITIN